MAKNSPVFTEHQPNPKRAKAKFKRGKGILAIKEAKMGHLEWSIKHDPLYRVKGIERYRKINGSIYL